MPSSPPNVGKPPSPGSRSRSSSSSRGGNGPSSRPGSRPGSPLGPPPLRPFNLDTLKTAILYARPGTGEVQRALESCTFQPKAPGFTSLVKHLGELRSFDKAIEVLRCMEEAAGIKPNTFTYTAVISTCSRCGEWAKAVEVFEEMKEASRNDPNCRPNNVTYSALIMACERGGDWRRAMQYYRELESTGITPDQGTFTAAVSSCLRSDDWRQTDNILDKMHEQGHVAPPALYRDLLVKYSTDGDYQSALNVFLTAQMNGIDPDDHMCRALMEVLEVAEQKQQVVRLLEEVWEGSIGIDVDTYNCALRAIAKEGDWEYARRVLRKIEEEGLFPNEETIEAVAKAYENGGKPAEAAEIRNEYRGRV